MTPVPLVGTRLRPEENAPHRRKETDMSQTHQRQSSRASDSVAPPTGWVEWIAFAGFMLIVEGGIQCIQGFVALFNDDYYLATRSGLILNVDYATWGFVHLLLGLVALATGLGLLTGRMWARVIGVILAGVSVLINIAFLAAFPVWSTLVIAIDIIIIYALIVHGREPKAMLRD